MIFLDVNMISINVNIYKILLCISEGRSTRHKKVLRIQGREEEGRRKESSAGELPLVSFSFVDVLEEFGFAGVIRLLVAEAAAAAALLHFDAFAAVHVWREAESRATISQQHTTSPT